MLFSSCIFYCSLKLCIFCLLYRFSFLWLDKLVLFLFFAEIASLLKGWVDWTDFLCWSSDFLVVVIRGRAYSWYSGVIGRGGRSERDFRGWGEGQEGSGGMEAEKIAFMSFGSLRSSVFKWNLIL